MGIVTEAQSASSTGAAQVVEHPEAVAAYVLGGELTQVVVRGVKRLFHGHSALFPVRVELVDLRRGRHVQPDGDAVAIARLFRRPAPQEYPGVVLRDAGE